MRLGLLRHTNIRACGNTCRRTLAHKKQKAPLSEIKTVREDDGVKEAKKWVAACAKYLEEEDACVLLIKAMIQQMNRLKKKKKN